MIHAKFNFFSKYCICFIIFFNDILLNNYYKLKNQANIPELSYFNNQTLQLFSPSDICYPTLFFMSDYRNYSHSNKIVKINLNDKNSFITFLGNDHIYNSYYGILEKHGLLRSFYKYGKMNLFFNKIKNNPYIHNKNNIYDLDKYQKVYSYFNSSFLFQKNILYEYYLKMKKLFFKDFNYMPETYCFPEESDLIYNKFKNYSLNINNLWILKPSDKGSAKGITLFRSLEKVLLSQFVLTK